MRENADQNNPEYGQFLRIVGEGARINGVGDYLVLLNVSQVAKVVENKSRHSTIET